MKSFKFVNISLYCGFTTDLSKSKFNALSSKTIVISSGGSSFKASILLISNAFILIEFALIRLVVNVDVNVDDEMTNKNKNKIDFKFLFIFIPPLYKFVII